MLFISYRYWLESACDILVMINYLSQLHRISLDDDFFLIRYHKLLMFFMTNFEFFLFECTYCLEELQIHKRSQIHASNLIHSELFFKKLIKAISLEQDDKTSHPCPEFSWGYYLAQPFWFLFSKWQTLLRMCVLSNFHIHVMHLKKHNQNLRGFGVFLIFS